MKAFSITPGVSNVHFQFHQPNTLSFCEKLYSSHDILVGVSCLPGHHDHKYRYWMKVQLIRSPPPLRPAPLTHKECGKPKNPLSNREAGICELGKLLCFLLSAESQFERMKNRENQSQKEERRKIRQAERETACPEFQPSFYLSLKHALSEF